MIEGGYHGVSDSVLWDIDLDEWEPELGDPKVQPTSHGVPSRIGEMVTMVPMNDADRLEDVLKKKQNEI